MVILFYVSLTHNEDEFIDIIDFIKADVKRLPSEIEKEYLNDLCNEIQTVLKIATSLFPTAIVVKIVMPFFEYGNAITVHGYEDSTFDYHQ
jgi:hypothetical protein